MTLYIKGTDVQVCGTLESMKGVTLIAGLNDDGTLIYVGEVNVKHNHFNDHAMAMRTATEVEK